MTTEPLAFVSDGLTLQGVLHLPDRLPAPFVVGCHGLFADKESPKQQALAAACCEKGLAFFRFDHRGCGKSDGDFALVTSPEARCRDLEDTVQAVAGHSQTLGPAGLFGSSMGGAVVLASARQWPGIRIVTVAAPLESEPVAAAVQLSDNPTAHSLPPLSMTGRCGSTWPTPLPALQTCCCFMENRMPWCRWNTPGKYTTCAPIPGTW